MRAHAHSPKVRGSAMVEFLITVALFIVPVLMYASYITDAMYMGLKAQEAAGAAAWSFSGQLLHDYDSWDHNGKFKTAKSAVESQVNSLYKGLDPWAVAANNQHPAMREGVSAKGLLTIVDCEQSTASSVIDPSDPSKFPLLGSMPPMSTLASKLHSGGLVSCNTEAQVTNWLWGKATKQGQIFKGQNLWPSNVLGSIQLCGVGPAKSGSCKNTGRSFTLYTDDWGLGEDGNSNGNDDQTNYQDFSAAMNTHFENVGEQVFENEALPIAYSPTIQLAEAQIPLISCSDELVVADQSLFDSQYDASGRGAWNLAYRRASETPWSGSSVPIDLSRDDPSPENNYEGSIQEPSYTWPVRHYAAGDIKADAYMHMERNRTKNYLSQ